MPCSAIFSRTSGFARPFAAAACSRRITAGGVPLTSRDERATARDPSTTSKAAIKAPRNALQAVRDPDVVRYALPFGVLGRIAHAAAVHSALAAIFDFRFARIRELFPRSQALDAGRPG